jgi:hypothetical protein
MIFLLGETRLERCGQPTARVAPLVGRGPDPTVTVDDLWLTLPRQASLIYQIGQNENAKAPEPSPRVGRGWETGI